MRATRFTEASREQPIQRSADWTKEWIRVTWQMPDRELQSQKGRSYRNESKLKDGC